MSKVDENINQEECPAEETLKQVAGKWKPMILRLAVDGNLRFNTLLKQLPGSNKESVSHALKDLEEAGILIKNVIKLKPLHIEYSLSDKGRSIVPILKNIELISVVPDTKKSCDI